MTHAEAVARLDAWLDDELAPEEAREVMGDVAAWAESAKARGERR